jgi:hypothetical protein
MAQNLLCWATIPHIFQTKFIKVKHATPRNKWSVCWSSSSITYLSPLEVELLIDKTSSIYLYVKLKALASWIFLSVTSFWRNSDSYEYKNKSARRASILDLYLEFDDSGHISTKIYDKRDDFNFKIINFPNMCSNIPASPAYDAYISQLIRYACKGK